MNVAFGASTVAVITVTAEDRVTTQIYTVTCSRPGPSTNADLSELHLFRTSHPSAGDVVLTPTFDASIDTYTATILNSVTQVSVRVVVAETGATLTTNGAVVASGGDSNGFPVGHGCLIMIPVVVTPIAGHTPWILSGQTKTYAITVSRGPSTDNTLSALACDRGALGPTFSSISSGPYTLYIAYTVATFTLTPTATIASAGAGTLYNNYPDGSVVTVDGTIVASGSASGGLSVGSGRTLTVDLIVSPQDSGAQAGTRTYSVEVTRAVSQDATLASLATSSGTWSSAFASNNEGVYTLTVDWNVDAISFTPITTNQVGPGVLQVAKEKATVTVASENIGAGGGVMGTGTASVPQPIGHACEHTVAIVVTAQDGVTTKTYQIKMKRAASQDASLAGIGLSAGTLASFTSGNTGLYSITIEQSAASIQVTPTVTQAVAGVGTLWGGFAEGATITVASDGATQAAVTSGQTSVSQPVGYGSFVDIVIEVTAQDTSTTMTYTLRVVRDPSIDCTLSSLSTDVGTLSPSFTAANLGPYEITVANTVTEVKATAAVTQGSNGVGTLSAGNNAGATFTIGSDAVSAASLGSGFASAAQTVGLGSYIIISILVTAQDQTSQKLYQIKVTRAASNDASLSNLVLSAGWGGITFTTGNLGPYVVAVANTVASVTATPTVTQAMAGDGTLVAGNTEGATVAVHSDAISSAGVASGTASAQQAIGHGSFVMVDVVVTAQDKTTTQTYQIKVSRAPSQDNTLAALTLSSGTFSPSFEAQVVTYTQAVPNSIPTVSLTLTATQATAGAGTLSPDGSGGTYPQGATITVVYTGNVHDASESSTHGVSSGGTTTSYAVGHDRYITLQIKVQPQDPAAALKTYTLTVTRAPCADATLSSLTVYPGTLTPSFAPDEFLLGYVATLDSADTYTTLTPTVTQRVSGAGNLVGTREIATIVVNTIANDNGVPCTPVNVAEGSSVVINVIVTAQDGSTTKHYRVTAVRPTSIVAVLSGISLSAGALSPTFDALIKSYTASVPFTASQVSVTSTAVHAGATILVDGPTKSILDSVVYLASPYTAVPSELGFAFLLNAQLNIGDVLALALPGFTLSAPFDPTMKGCGSTAFAVTTPSAGTLHFEAATAFLPAYSQCSVTLGTGVTTPTVAQGSNLNTRTIAATLSAAPDISASPVKFSPAIADVALATSILVLAKPIAWAETSISFTFAANVPIEHDDYLTLTLPTFTLAPGAPSTHGCGSTVFQATGSDSRLSTASLQLVAKGAQLAQERVCTVTIATGITTGYTGTVASAFKAGATISKASDIAGSTTILSASAVQAPASFDFIVSSSGGSDTWLVNGVAASQLDLTVGQTYVFNLDDNTNNDFVVGLSSTSDGTHNSGVEYAAGVTYLLGISGHGTVVSSWDGFKGGFQWASSRRVLFTPRSHGTFYYYCPTSSGMGGVLNIVDSTPALAQSMLTIQNPVTSAASDITFSFALNKELSENDKIFLTLPTFSFDQSIPAPTLTNCNPATFSASASDSGKASAKLTLTAQTATLPAGSQCTVQFPSGITTSTAVTTANDQSLKVAVELTIESQPDIAPVPITTSQAVHRAILSTSRLIVAKPVTATASSFSFAFHLNTILEVGDVVTLTLPLFVFNSFSSPLTLGCGSTTFSAAYSSPGTTTAMVRLTVQTATLPAGSLCTVTLETGLTLSHHTQLATDITRTVLVTLARAENTLIAPIQSSPAVYEALGDVTASGAASIQHLTRPLAAGTTTLVKVYVIGQNEVTVNRYDVNVYRAMDVATDASLSSLGLNAGIDAEHAELIVEDPVVACESPIKFMFALTAPLRIGDKLIITLPTWTFANSLTPLVSGCGTTTFAGGNIAVNSGAANAKLELVGANADLAASTQCIIRIATGVTTSGSPQAANLASRTLAVDLAHTSDIYEHPIQVSTGVVASALIHSSLAIAHPVTSVETAVSYTWAINTYMLPGDHLDLVLPGFRFGSTFGALGTPYVSAFDCGGVQATRTFTATANPNGDADKLRLVLGGAQVVPETLCTVSIASGITTSISGQAANDVSRTVRLGLGLRVNHASWTPRCQ